MGAGGLAAGRSPGEALSALLPVRPGRSAGGGQALLGRRRSRRERDPTSGVGRVGYSSRPARTPLPSLSVMGSP